MITMRHMMMNGNACDNGRGPRGFFTILALLMLGTTMAMAQPRDPSYRLPVAPPRILNQVGIEQKLDSQVPLDLPFKDETGKSIMLGDYFKEKPVILVLAYYECPMLCTEVLNGVARTLRPISFDMGKEYEVVTVSINPKETPELAAKKKANYVKRYGRPGTEGGWHFLTGEQSSIDRLAKAVGFNYVYDTNSAQYAHAGGIMVLTPGGRLSRYFYGVEYAPDDVRLGLVEASEGKIGTAVDKVLLLCFHYDPTTGRYGVAILTAIRIAGIAVLLGLGIFVYRAIRRDRRKKLGAELAASGAQSVEIRNGSIH
jgi:protein SCO1/2